MDITGLADLALKLQAQGATRVELDDKDVRLVVRFARPPSLSAETTPAPSPAPGSEPFELGHVLVRDEKLRELEEKARRWDAIDCGL